MTINTRVYGKEILSQNRFKLFLSHEACKDSINDLPCLQLSTKYPLIATCEYDENFLYDVVSTGVHVYVYVYHVELSMASRVTGHMTHIFVNTLAIS